VDEILPNMDEICPSVDEIFSQVWMRSVAECG
jgi:hypothetical protein